MNVEMLDILFKYNIRHLIKDKKTDLFKPNKTVEVFKDLDINNNMIIEREEFKVFVDSVILSNKKRHESIDKIINKLFDKYDLDKDNKIDYYEFLKLLQY